MLRRIEPLTALLVALCVGWTVWAKWSGATLAEAGAVNDRLLWRGWGEYGRLATHLLLHDPRGWLHLAVNMLSLVLIGRIVARACGRPVYLACLLLSAQAGLAFSLLREPGWRVGISGGIAGLLGLLLALEWSVSKSLGAFLKQRNTIIIFVIVVLSTALGVYIEHAREGIVIDHAAHAGGFGFGFLAGVAYYTRRGLRPWRGALVALVLGVLPIAYVCYPFRNVDFLLYRGERAWRAGEKETAAGYYERVLALDPGHVSAGARLALVRDDPAPLKGLREPRNAAESHAFLEAHLTLARHRLVSHAEVARDLLRRARRIRIGSAGLWFQFAEAAEEAGWSEEALAAYRESARWLRLDGRTSEEWRPQVRALRLAVARPAWQGEMAPGPRLDLALETVEIALGAARGLNGALPADAHEDLERIVAASAFVLDGVARRPLDPVEEVRLLHGKLERLFRLLAENTGRREREPLYLFLSAHWWWREADAPDAVPGAEVQARFRAALTEAHRQGNEAVQVQAERWFRARGLPVPPPDLAGDEEGG
ncbi:MAG: rhomboid family intramembrane serine protease [Planctomycetota bacterium]|jgi:membrane associated rhomboid family serine protease